MSVIIPMYNAATTIARTLQSAQAQTERLIEIIVVDDGSTDAGPRIVRMAKRRDPRIVLRTQRNAGVAAARNNAVGVARAPYIAPLDADDLWLPNKLALQLREFSRGASNTAFVYCYFDAIDSRDRLLWHGPRERIDGPALHALLAHDVVGNGSNALMRTDLVRKIGGYDATLRQAGGQGAEDWQVALRLAELGEIACVPEVLVGYRRTRGNMSGDSLQMLQSSRLVAEPFRERYPDLAPCIESHIHDRRRWLLARAVSEVNLRGFVAMSRDIGAPLELAKLMASIALPLATQFGSTALHALRLRRRTGFGLGSEKILLTEQFTQLAPAAGRSVTKPVADHAPQDTAESPRGKR